MKQSISIGEKTLAIGPADPSGSPDEGLRLIQDFLRVKRDDLRKAILSFVTETLKVQHEEDCDRANDNTNDVESSVGVAVNATMTLKSVQSQLAVARDQISQMKKLVSEFKLPDSGMGVL